MLPRYFDGVTVKRLPDENGFKMVYMGMEMPFLITNRSFYNCYYEIDGSEPGEYIFIVSGWGNEFYQNKYAKMAGRDVIGITNLNYFSIKPFKNHYGDVIGTHIF